MTQPLIDAEMFAKIEALAADAEKDVWRMQDNGWGGYAILHQGGEWDEKNAEGDAFTIRSEDDAEAVIGARQALPRLVAEIKRLQTLVPAPVYQARREPPPSPGRERVFGIVLDYMLDRIVAGKDKYGTFLETHNGRDPLWDARDESTDLTMYLTQAIREKENPTNESFLRMIVNLARSIEREIGEIGRGEGNDRIDAICKAVWKRGLSVTIWRGATATIDYMPDNELDQETCLSNSGWRTQQTGTMCASVILDKDEGELSSILQIAIREQHEWWRPTL